MVNEPTRDTEASLYLCLGDTANSCAPMCRIHCYKHTHRHPPPTPDIHGASIHATVSDENGSALCQGDYGRGSPAADTSGRPSNRPHGLQLWAGAGSDKSSTEQ